MAGSPLSLRVRNRVERMRQRPWRMAAYVSPERHIVMGGAPRSGTTLLRRLLDRHPSICAGPETKLFVPAAFNLEWLSQAFDIPLHELEAMRRESRSQAAFIDAFAARVKRACGKPRWAEKTPLNIRSLDWIGEHFPEASIVHILRDGRDTVCSMRQHPDWRWKDGAWEKVLVPRPLETYARRWLADTAAGMRMRHDRRYVELRYEDVVAEPAAVLRRVCEAVGESADETWLDEVTRPSAQVRSDGPEGQDLPWGPGGREEQAARPDDKGAISTASVGRWKQDLNADEQALLARLCGPRLRELGYEA